jgi:hypothetical protein
MQRLWLLQILVLGGFQVLLLCCKCCRVLLMWHK